MSSAIEVLKSEKVLYIEKIKEIESRFNGMPSDIKESYQKSVKVYQEFIDALGEAIVALELERDWNCGKECNDNLLSENNLLKLKEQKLVKWLEKEIALWKIEVEKSKDKEKYEDWVQSMNEQRLWAYEEVLEKIGEQK